MAASFVQVTKPPEKSGHAVPGFWYYWKITKL